VDEEFCYLTTTGRVSGRPHTIEIWFARQGDRLYLLSGGGGRSDWVRNLQRRAAVTVRIGDRHGLQVPARARVLDPGTPEDGLARRLLYEKYRAGYGGDLTRWRDRSLPIALDLGAQGPG
jgi:deazaflavin-dependent oxidoreductase (nitroreductase family)